MNTPTLFVTTEEYKSFINVTGVTLDPFYQSLIGYVSAWVQSYTMQTLEYTEGIIEYINPRGLEYVTLKQRPVINVVNLWYDPTGLWGQAAGSFVSANTIQVVGDDYAVRFDAYSPLLDSGNGAHYSKSGQIVLLRGQQQPRWARRGHNIRPEMENALGTLKAEYNAGYPTEIFPDDLKLGVLLLTRALHMTGKNAGWLATSEGTKYYNYALSDTLNRELHIKNVLASYKGQGMSFV